jgi:uncharacterized membrane protein YvbJ
MEITLSQEIRPIPKKTVIIIAIVIICGIFAYIMNEISKSSKATKVLHAIGYKNIDNVYVAKIMKFKNEDTSVEGNKFTLKFRNLDTNKNCKGFVWADFKKNIIHDIDCK